MFNGATNFYNLNNENFHDFLMEMYRKIDLLDKDTNYIRNHLIDELRKELRKIIANGELIVDIESVVDDFLINGLAENKVVRDIKKKLEECSSQLDTITNINGKKIYQFSNVKSMKTYNLKVNEVCETLGYYSTNDGGGCKYLVETQSKGLGSVLLTNGLYANIIFDNDKRVNVLTLGVKRNVEEDQSILVNELLKAPTKIIL